MNVIEAAKAAGIVATFFDLQGPVAFEATHATLERFAQIIRNQALEDAANLFMSQDRFSVSGLIRAMKKDQP